MRELRRELLIWGGIPGLIVLGVGMVVWLRADAVQTSRRAIAAVHQRYESHYLGEGDRLPASAALSLATERATGQQAALARAEEALVVALPMEYRTERFPDASGLQQRLHYALRAQAQRASVHVPGTLPLESGISSDIATRTMELSQLYLLDQALRAVMAVSKQIDQVELLPPFGDPAARYAGFACQVVFRAPFRNCHNLLGSLAQHPAGLYVRTIDLRPLPSESTMTCTLELGVLVTRRADWTIAEPAPAAETPLRRRRR